MVDAREIEQFVFQEALLQDEHRYAEWESLWTDDGILWIPANGSDGDTNSKVSLVFDNRARIAARVKQLSSGLHYAQVPPSRLRRVISNFEISDEGGSEVVVLSNFVLLESRPERLTTWGGRTEHRLRRVGDVWKMARKSVYLVNNDQPLETLAFLI